LFITEDFADEEGLEKYFLKIMVQGAILNYVPINGIG
jgi:hypothetical protein